MKYKYKFNELDCANCANAIEQKLNSDKNIKTASVNFSKLSLIVETDLDKDVKKYVNNIIASVEPDSFVIDIGEESDTKKKVKNDILRLVTAIIIAVVGMIIGDSLLSKILIIISYILLLEKTTITAVKLLVRSRTINENLLVTISCIGAYLTNNIHEGLMVVILYEIGKILEEIAVNNSRRSISNLMDIKQEYANLKKGDEIKKVNPEQVKIDDIIVIKQGEKVPLDGIIVKGSAKLNTSALTGESKLSSVKAGDEVLSGTVNINGLFELKVTSAYTNSTVSRILELVETATDRKAKTETFVARMAKIYTPIVIILAILTAIILPLFFKVPSNVAIYRALVFLVVSCPCAIAISVPLSYFTGIGAASRLGILIKGSDYLDSLCAVNKIVFDKTGTITTGTFSDYNLKILDDNYKEDEIKQIYAKGEKLSNHPIAMSIVNLFNKNIKTNDVKNYKEISGKGVEFVLDEDKIKIGSSEFCNASKKDGYIYLNINDNNVAKLELLDGVKKGTKKTIATLKSMNITPKMFTGDSESIAKKIAKSVGIDDVSYEMLPEDKYKLLENVIKENSGKTAFVGDGINDAPSLALADIGISMGGVGSASAIEASDIVIMTDDLAKIPVGIKIAKKTNHIIKQNLLFAIGVKVLVLTLSTVGLASMWQAVFADTGVTLITILNTTRILKREKSKK